MKKITVVIETKQVVKRIGSIVVRIKQPKQKVVCS